MRSRDWVRLLSDMYEWVAIWMPDELDHLRTPLFRAADRWEKRLRTIDRWTAIARVRGKK
jgi:hypothetical protein